MVNHLPLGVEAKALHAVHAVKHFTILASTCVHYKKDRTSIPVYRRKGMSRRSPAAWGRRKAPPSCPPGPARRLSGSGRPSSRCPRPGSSWAAAAATPRWRTPAGASKPERKRRSDRCTQTLQTPTSQITTTGVITSLYHKWYLVCSRNYYCRVRIMIPRFPILSTAVQTHVRYHTAKKHTH